MNIVFTNKYTLVDKIKKGETFTLVIISSNDESSKLLESLKDFNSLQPVFLINSVGIEQDIETITGVKLFPATIFFHEKVGVQKNTSASDNLIAISDIQFRKLLTDHKRSLLPLGSYIVGQTRRIVEGQEFVEILRKNGGYRSIVHGGALTKSIIRHGTGKMAENGGMIYSGDIVSVFKEDQKEPVLCGVITFRNAAFFIIEFKNETQTFHLMNTFFNHIFYITGNIFLGDESRNNLLRC